MHGLEIAFGHEGSVVWWQMCLRALVIFTSGIVLLRVGGLRILGHQSAFDLLVTVSPARCWGAR